MRSKTVVVANTTVSFLLLFTYAYFFGQQSIQRYLKRSVILIEEEEKNVLIPSPGNFSSSVSLNLKILHFSYHNHARKSKSKFCNWVEK